MDIDRNLLIEQARIVGALIDDVPGHAFTADEKVSLEGVWNLLHALLDVPEGEYIEVWVKEGLLDE